jgi:hypothetical protein
MVGLVGLVLSGALALAAPAVGATGDQSVAYQSATLTGYAAFAPARGRTIVFRSRFRLPR